MDGARTNRAPIALRIVIDPPPVKTSDPYEIYVFGVPDGYRVRTPAVIGQYVKGGRVGLKLSVHLEPITEEEACNQTEPTYGLIRSRNSAKR